MSEKDSSSKPEEFQFKAEMSQLLHLITHSLYSHREIFLRELISNASDALNKLHFKSLTDQSVLGDDGDLKIEIDLNEEEKTFSIRDNGIGMSKIDLQENIGTVASSGTANFLKELTGDNKKDMELIGQFGVGFYAVFMVADEVTIETRAFNEEKGYKWVSNGTGSYTIEDIALEQRGTKISFKFKEEAEEFASKWRTESVIKKYSNFVSFPITLNSEKTNQSTALWTKQKSDVKEEEYKEFFKYIANSSQDPMDWLHLSVEAPVQFKSILYIPEEADRFLFTQDFETKLHLYVKKIFIQNDCKELLPKYMRFISGVVDSEDLSLNVSREVTQKSGVLDKINKYLMRKLLGMFKEWAEKDDEKYTKFWKSFGYFIKEGIHSDFMNKDKLVELYRCYSSNNPEKLTSLKEYVERMKPDQEEIYYIFGKDREIIENSPNLEYFKKNDIEVLYLFEEIDDFIMPSIMTYNEKNIVGIDKADLKLKEDAAEDEKEALSDSSKKEIIQCFKDVLGDLVSDVIESKRLVDSACTLVSPKDAMNANIERMMKMMDQNFQGSKRVMEVNLSNPLIKNLSALHEKQPENVMIKECIKQLYDGASLLEGTLENPALMVPRGTRFMEKATELYLNSLNEK